MTTHTARALAALADAGITSHAVAAELGVHPTTVARWAAGRRQPNPGNTRLLRDLVDDLSRAVLAGDPIADAAQGQHLQRAVHYLTPEAERADLALLRDSVRATMRRSGALVSATVDVDPFALCRGRAAERADAIDLALAA